MTELDDLAETMRVLARPGLRIRVDGDHLVITLVNPAHPSVELVSYEMTPLDGQWPDDMAEIVRSFDEFNDVATEQVARAVTTDLPMGLAQDIYNKGILLNSHGWYDVFQFDVTGLEHDIDQWTAR
jgi:hypothetical protein